VLLNNPLCVVAYAAASWKFFNSRINEEEAALIYFFGGTYEDYQKTTMSGVPFIKGCLLTDGERRTMNGHAGVNLRT
jgi:protein-S-isoprenylcysteine O-methyltransferase